MGGGVFGSSGVALAKAVFQADRNACATRETADRTVRRIRELNAERRAWARFSTTRLAEKYT